MKNEPSRGLTDCWCPEPYAPGVWWLGDGHGHHLLKKLFTEEAARIYAQQCNATFRALQNNHT